MGTLYRGWLSGAVTAAVVSAIMLSGAARTAYAQKTLANDAESADYTAVTKDVAAKNGPQLLTDLDKWKKDFPDSAFKNDREAMYFQAYDFSKQYDKVLEKAKELMGQNLDSLFPDPKDGPRLVLQILFPATTAITQIPNPTPDQIATATQAANMLKDYNRKPSDVSDADWAGARKSMTDAAEGVKYQLAIAPAVAADAKKDCPAGEVAWAKALGDYPDKAAISYRLAVAYRCEKKNDQALYEFARAVAIDPTLGGTQNATTITNYVKNYYTSYHGSAEGFDQFEATAKTSPLPPADLHIRTAQEIAEEQQKQFETSHPDIALWLKLKATLTSDQGAQYFDSSMKGAQVPELRGTVLESKCRAKELQVAVPLPDATGPLVAEITLKLATPLTGKAESSQVTFVGVADAFSNSPFMVTMTLDKKDIKDLKVAACAAAAPVRKKKK